ncbi:hypothetical protein ES704_02796 [subsurface metagenome]|jgi:hypothetical protein
MATIAELLEVKQGDVEWDAWFTDKMSITHLALLEDHLLDYSRRSVDDQCRNCMLWHCEKLKGYSIYEAPKFFDGDHESTYQKVGELAQAVQDRLVNLAQSEALDYAKKVRDLRYELIGYGVYDFTVAQDRHFEELEAYREAELSAPMKLLTKKIRGKLPPLYSQEKVQDPIVQVKFFTPDSNWTWYGIEFDGKDLFFGWVVGLEKEMGYFSLKELESARGPLGLAIERDKWFTPLRLSEVKKLHQGAGVRTNPGELVKFIKVKEAEMEQRREYEIRMLTASELRQIADIMDNPALPEGTDHNPDMLIRPKMFTAPLGKVTLEVFFAKTGPKTIQQLLQRQTLLEQHQKDRPQDIIFFKDTIMKHYYPKEDFHPDSFRVAKPEPGVMVTLGCLKKHKWYPERLECVPTQTLHRTIVPRIEKYIKEAEEWEAVGVPAQHRETEVGIVPRELVEVING